MVGAGDRTQGPMQALPVSHTPLFTKGRELSPQQRRQWEQPLKKEGGGDNQIHREAVTVSLSYSVEGLGKDAEPCNLMIAKVPKNKMQPC